MMETLATFIATHLADIVTIIVVFLIGELVLTLYARNIAKKAAEGRGKRARTVAKLMHHVGHAALCIMLAFWVLRLFGVDPTPLLASAGVVGLALGVGAQTLVKDFIAGIFILAENQYSVGDRVKLGGIEGEVQHLTIRSTVLKDDDGNTVYIPNGTVTMVVNIKK